MLQERRFDTGTVTLNYAEGPPNGPPFVILHGGSASWRYADALIDLLADRWHVYAPDLRGHGRSGHVPGRYRLPDYAEDTATFLAGVVGDPAVVYGHSLGGAAAVMAAARRPGLIRAIVVGDAPLSRDLMTETPGHRRQNELWLTLAGRPEAEIAAALKEMLVTDPGNGATVRAGDVFGEDSPWFAFQATNLHRLDPGMLAAVLAGPAVLFAGYEAEALLPAIACPVLLLQADPAAGGGLSDAEVALGMRLLPRASHVRLAGVGHELHGLEPKRVVEAMGPFLAAL